MLKYLTLSLIPLSLFCSDIKLEQSQLQQIGLKVWQNECRGTIEGLISWNENENFASLGIGHFIWYPEGVEKKYEESFPALIAYITPILKAKEKEIPSWIKSAKGCPWKTREEFLNDKRSKKMNQLRDLLSDTIEFQTSFIFEQFKKAEVTLSPNLDDIHKAYLEALKKSPQGVFALIDYTHFKGIGLSPIERYRGEGWGVLQVLQNLPEQIAEDKILDEFILSAKKVLSRRVKNAPVHKKEDNWLNGWYKRIESYSKT